MPKTVLALTPHPDDAEFFAGGTLAKMIREGARALLVIATDGRRGSFEHDSQTLASLRREEAGRAAAVLGAESPILLGHPDLELDRLPPGILREQFIRLIRQHKPDVVIAQDPFAPFETHPDHRAVAWAASDAVAFSPLPLMHPEHHLQGLEPHFVAEKYLYSDDPSSANRIVDIGDTLPIKLAALAEHKTQMDFLVQDVLMQARLGGLDLRPMLGEALDDPMAAVRWAMEAQASQVGARGGFRYGEAFRYTRFHPFVENLLGSQAGV